MLKQNELTFALIGAGSRGHGFAEWIRDRIAPGAIRAVADPIPERRNRIAEMHNIPEANQFETWQELLAQPRFGDILINTTMDQDHVGSSCAALKLGYHMLLEKPMATTIDDVIAIDEAQKQAGKVVSVCHSLRYHQVYERVLELLKSGVIGDVVSIDQLEAVEHIHQSHSFVRGNWGNESRATFMLMAKSCHDIDVIASLVPADCLKVSSFGSLKHFRRENAPVGAPKYCVEGCPVGTECPYNSVKIYGQRPGWRGSSEMADLTPLETLEALKTNRFGRCVYQTDNDVVDHQVVNMEFEGGVTATFTMTAFTPWGGRYLRIHGSKGYIEAKVDDNCIDMWEFWAGNRHTRFDIPRETGGHGGGDSRVMFNLVNAVLANDPTMVRTGTNESRRTHSIVFGAEASRRTGQVIDLSQTATIKSILEG